MTKAGERIRLRQLEYYARHMSARPPSTGAHGDSNLQLPGVAIPMNREVQVGVLVLERRRLSDRHPAALESRLSLEACVKSVQLFEEPIQVSSGHPDLGLTGISVRAHLNREAWKFRILFD